MKLFVRTISNNISYDEYFNYFNQFGHILELTLKPGIGFLIYEDEKSAIDALNTAHYIKGIKIEIDRGREYSNNPVPRSGFSYGNSYDNRNSSEGREDRNFCEYCRKCPKHGTYNRNMNFDNNRGSIRDMKELDKNKIVIEGIPYLRDHIALKNFVYDMGVNPGFVKLAQNKRIGILEFQTMEEKLDALKILDNKPYDGGVLRSRQFFTDDPRDQKNFERTQEAKEQSEKQIEMIYDDIETYKKG